MIQKRIILDLINFINTQEPSITNNLLIGFDLLDTNRNSICISIPDSDDEGDRYNDVTGLFKAGTLKISIFFRDISGVEGENDLEAYDFLDNLANYIKKNYTYKVINENLQEWVNDIVIIKKAKMARLYEGNIKDYETQIAFNYSYKV